MFASKPFASTQRRYIRKSISAQSWLSVPPAPGMDGHDGVVEVVLPVQQRGELEGIELAAELLLRLHRVPRRLVTVLFAQLEENAEIFPGAVDLGMATG